MGGKKGWDNFCASKISMENPPTYPLNQVATHNVDPQGVKQFITNCRSDD